MKKNLMIDLLKAAAVQLQVDTTGKLWLNVDGRCLVRIQHCDYVEIDSPFEETQVLVPR